MLFIFQIDAVKQFDQAEWANVDMVADLLKCQSLNKQLQDEVDSLKVEAENEKAQLTADLAECKTQNTEFETSLADQQKAIDMLQAELANYKQVLIRE